MSAKSFTKTSNISFVGPKRISTYRCFGHITPQGTNVEDDAPPVFWPGTYLAGSYVITYLGGARILPFAPTCFFLEYPVLSGGYEVYYSGGDQTSSFPGASNGCLASTAAVESANSGLAYSFTHTGGQIGISLDLTAYAHRGDLLPYFLLCGLEDGIDSDVYFVGGQTRILNSDVVFVTPVTTTAFNLSSDVVFRGQPLAPGQQNLLSKYKEAQRDALIQKPCTTCGGIDCTDTEIAYSLEGAGLPLVPVCPTGVDCSKFGSGFHLQCCDGTRYDYNFSPEITDDQKRVIITNAMADCARKLPFCTNNCPNPPCAPPCLVPPCIIYGNHLATCPAECPSGGTFIESIAPGTYFAFTQIEADQIAVRAACALAKDHRLCFLGLESVICVDSLYSDEFVMTGKYVAAYPSSDIISVVDGALPNGIVLNEGSSFITGGRCKLEGTPTVAGTYTFTIGVTLNTFGSPGFGDHQQREYTIKVCAITPDTLPDAKIGVDYDQALFVTPDHDTSTEVWTLITSLPAGLELDAEGFITGKPTGPSESHNVTVKCCFTLDSEPVCCSKQFTLTVNEGTCTEQTVVPYQATGWKYLQIGVDTAPPANYETIAFDDSGWTDGQAAFGEGPDVGVPCPLISTVQTAWTRDTRLVLRKHITLAAGTKNLRLRFAVDNDVLAIWFNGVLLASNLHHDFCPSLPNFEKMATDGSLIVGDNVVAVLCRDHYLVSPPNGDQSFFDLSVVACVI